MYMDENFLLQTKTAQTLYHEHAAKMPIFDYHCHLPPKQSADDIRFENIMQAWLYVDHYKWRAMRTNGVDKRYCAGGAPDWEKCEKWTQTIPDAIRNPLYHWTHLELRLKRIEITFQIFGKTDNFKHNGNLLCNKASYNPFIKESTDFY